MSMILLQSKLEPFNELVKEIKKDTILNEQLFSLIVFGSYIRGDFIEDQSDLDIYAVFNEMTSENTSRLQELIEKHVEIKYKVLDFACSNLEEIDDPLTKGYPFKFLISDQEDFRKHHLVIYGNEIVDRIPVYSWKETRQWRAKRLIENIEKFKDKPDLLRISAGQTILLMTSDAGAKNIGKDETLRVLKQIGDDQALDIFTAYLDGVELNYPFEYWAEFIKSRLASYIS